MRIDATMTEQTKTKMSVIFPTEPNKVVVHPLPKGAGMVTYLATDYLWIEAWMPDGYKTIDQELDHDNDGFYHSFCDGCHRNCYDFLREYEDEDGEVDWDHSELKNHCNVHDNGYHGQHCPEGFKFDFESINFSISPMVFGVAINHLGDPKHYDKFAVISDKAYLCDGFEDDEGFHRTDSLMASNVYGDRDDIGGICWGRNDRPMNLASIVDKYFSTQFNNDLTGLEMFKENSNYVKTLIGSDDYCLDEKTKILCNFSPDALMLISASQDVSAFFQLLSAGFKSLPEAPHVMVVPLFNTTVEKNGNTFNGYATIQDAVDKQWFVTHDGLIVGQI